MTLDATLQIARNNDAIDNFEMNIILSRDYTIFNPISYDQINTLSAEDTRWSSRRNVTTIMEYSKVITMALITRFFDENREN